ncbi:MAG: hypothetical protein MRJ93_12520 [Nitrososphaeraceae archaeon]|nr:hypothetical protein [Nitrososphaeraceae archaeon]
MNKSKLQGTMLSAILVASSLLFVSWISEHNAEADIICPPTCDEAKQHLDEAKKSLDAGDTEGAKTHIDKARESIK